MSYQTDKKVLFSEFALCEKYGKIEITKYKENQEKYWSKEQPLIQGAAILIKRSRLQSSASVSAVMVGREDVHNTSLIPGLHTSDTNTFANFDKYICQFGQLHLPILTNTFANLDKYICQLGQKQIHLPIWTNTLDITTTACARN